MQYGARLDTRIGIRAAKQNLGNMFSQGYYLESHTTDHEDTVIHYI